MKRFLTNFTALALVFHGTFSLAAGRIQNEDVKSYSDLKTAVLTTTGNLSSISACITSIGSTSGLAVGQFIYDSTTPANITVGTTIAGLPGTCSAGQVQMSANAAGNGTGDTITFGGQLSQLINDSKVYMTSGSIAEQLSTSIGDGKLFTASSILTTKGDILGFGSTTVRFPVGSDGQVLTADSSQTDGIKWAASASAPQSSVDSQNVGLAASVATNALTIALKQSDGSTNCSSSPNSCSISFRGTTAGTGSFTQVSVTGALSITVPSGTTLGTANGGTYYIMVYALNNAGTVELALSTAAAFDEGTLQTTTAISGGSAQHVLYSTTARTSVGVRLIGRIRVSESTAGTWTSVPSEVSVLPFPKLTPPTVQLLTSGSSATYTTPTAPSIPLYLDVECTGQGGGGAGSSTLAAADGGAGANGASTAFGTSLISAGGGNAGQPGDSSPAAGGTASVSSPALKIAAYTGASGNGGIETNATVTNLRLSGGAGGGTLWSGGGASGPSTAGVGGANGSGAGGGGGGCPSSGNVRCGGGGGAGGYAHGLIPSPAATYTYSIGTGGGGTGSAGTSGFAGGAGGNGACAVVEKYQ